MAPALRLLLAALLASVPLTSAAQDPSAPGRQTYTVPRASGPIAVDGALDEDAWASAARIPVAYEWSPGDNTAPVEETTCLLTFDGERLYIGFQAKDRKPSEIRAHLADRDVPFQDDTVGFFIDPFNDERRGFQFRINPLGVQMEAANSDVDGTEDWSWDAIWESKGTITADGYVVEVAIPFSSLRFPRTEGVQTWGFIAMRDLPRSLRHRMRSNFTDKKKSCLVCQFDKITGIEGITPGRNLEIAPTVTTTRTDRRHDFPGGPLERGDVDPDAGLSVRWGVTPNLTLNAAVNPDFSQVEADVAQFEINTRFALFFPERRPLFLEGADFFSTPVSAVFTRTMADPQWGVKLTGKEGRSALGGFLVRDRITNLLFPANEGSAVDTIERGAWSGVGRYRRDIGRTSTVGALVTLREGEGYDNRVAGVDGTVSLTRSDTLRVQAVLSSTEYPNPVAAANGQPRGRFSGHAYFADYTHLTRSWIWFATTTGYSPDFRADLGFVPRVDVRTAAAGVQHNRWARGPTWYSRLQFAALFDAAEDFGGRLTDRGFDFPITYFGKMQSVLSYNPAPNVETYQGVRYDNFRHNLSGEIRPSGDLSLSVSATIGETIDFANGRPADVFRIRPQVGFGIARRLNGTLAHSLQDLDVAGGRLFRARLTEARVVLHLDVRTFLRAILQYTDIERNTRLYRSAVPPHTRRLFSQYLFSYKLNPQTVLLVGYSDNANGGQNPDLSRYDLTRTDRTFFVKVGYAWVL